MPRIVIPTRTSLEHYSKIQCQLVWRNDLYSTNKKGWDLNLIESFTSPNQHTKIFNVKAKFHLNVRLLTVSKKLCFFFKCRKYTIDTLMLFNWIGGNGGVIWDIYAVILLKLGHTKGKPVKAEKHCHIIVAISPKSSTLFLSLY